VSRLKAWFSKHIIATGTIITTITGTAAASVMVTSIGTMAMLIATATGMYVAITTTIDSAWFFST
jgi:hypothetical protein